jgi:hypothetical protein
MNPKYIWPAISLMSAAVGVLLMVLIDAWNFFGFHTVEHHFVDLHYIFAAFECARMDIDVVVANPCDAMMRRFVYPPVWLDFSFLPFEAGDEVWFGWLLAAAYLAAATALMWPRSLPATSIALLLLLSPSSIYLIERGNVDAVLFILAALIILPGTFRNEMRRIFALLLATLAALLKVYPVVLILAVMPSFCVTRRRFVAYLLILIIILGAYFTLNWTDLAHFISGVPMPESLVMFGALLLPWSLELVFSSPIPEILNQQAILLVIFLVLSGFLFLLFNSKRLLKIEGITQESRLFVGGGLILVFCFLVGINVPYRLVFVIFMFPYLVAMLMQKGCSRIDKFLAGFILFWSVLACWNMLLIVRLVEHFASLKTEREAQALKFWVDSYILTYQLVTWVAMAVTMVMVIQALRCAHCPSAFTRLDD